MNFLNSGQGDVLGCGHTSHYREYALPFTLSMYTRLLQLYEGIVMLLPYGIVEFY